MFYVFNGILHSFIKGSKMSILLTKIIAIVTVGMTVFTSAFDIVKPDINENNSLTDEEAIEEGFYLYDDKSYATSVSYEDWERTNIGEYPIDIDKIEPKTLTYSEALDMCNMPKEYA